VRAHIARLPILLDNGEPVHVTVSIGVAALDAGSSRELNELLAAADAALYRAKASGRDQVQMISTSRGLSAVSPPEDDRATDPILFWHPAATRVQAASGGSVQPADGCVDGGGDDGSTSTATTSAVAV